MKKLQRSLFVRILVGLLLGALGGLLYWYLFDSSSEACTSGTCPLVSTPWPKTFLFAAMGALLATSIPSTSKTEK